jgi:hypothetical protein
MLQDSQTALDVATDEEVTTRTTALPRARRQAFIGVSPASRPFPTVLLLLSLFLPYVSILSGTSVFLLSPQGSRNKENHYHQSLPGTRCCWRPKWAPRSLHPGKQSNKDTLTRVQQTHAHTHAAPCSRSLSPRERERTRESILGTTWITKGAARHQRLLVCSQCVANVFLGTTWITKGAGRHQRRRLVTLSRALGLVLWGLCSRCW